MAETVHWPVLEGIHWLASEGMDKKMKPELSYLICSQKQELEQVLIQSHLQSDTTAQSC